MYMVYGYNHFRKHFFNSSFFGLNSKEEKWPGHWTFLLNSAIQFHTYEKHIAPLHSCFTIPHNQNACRHFSYLIRKLSATKT